MQIEVVREAGRVRISVSGEVDVMTVPDFRTALNGALEGAGSGIVVSVDLANVELIDATGLGALVGAHRRAVRSGALLQLVNPPRAVQRLLDITRLDRVLSVVTSEELSPVA